MRKTVSMQAAKVRAVAELAKSFDQAVQGHPTGAIYATTDGREVGVFVVPKGCVSAITSLLDGMCGSGSVTEVAILPAEAN